MYQFPRGEDLWSCVRKQLESGKMRITNIHKYIHMYVYICRIQTNGDIENHWSSSKKCCVAIHTKICRN